MVVVVVVVVEVGMVGVVDVDDCSVEGTVVGGVVVVLHTTTPQISTQAQGLDEGVGNTRRQLGAVGKQVG